MKKVTILLSVIFAFAFNVSAQSFEILDESDNVITGQTIIVPLTIGGDAEFTMKVKNKTGEQVSAKIYRSYLAGPVDGCFTSMCTPITTLSTSGTCLTGSSTNLFILNPNEISGDAHMIFNQGSVGGLSTIQYKVINQDNSSDFNFVNVTYSTLTSISTGIAREFLVFPNPAVSSFTIQHNYGTKAVVEVFNVLGKSVAKINTSADNSVNVDCSKWENGYYFCRLFNDGKIEKTIKLVVTH